MRRGCQLVLPPFLGRLPGRVADGCVWLWEAGCALKKFAEWFDLRSRSPGPGQREGVQQLPGACDMFGQISQMGTVIIETGGRY